MFLPAKNLGKINSRLKEASGLVASINNPGALWSLNDSGNTTEVFLIDERAKIEMTCQLEGIENRDWEDIAMGPGPEKGVNYVYVGDIGDNKSNDEYKFVYRFPEPKNAGDKNQKITRFDTLVLKLPDGRRDTETMIIDPLTNNLYLVSKREDSVMVYEAAYPFKSDTLTMKRVCKLPFKLIVAGSISMDGQEVLLKNYAKIYYWKRNAGETIPQVLIRTPIQLTYEPEHQGESIAWARDNSGFFTLSESSVVDRAQLRFYRRK